MRASCCQCCVARRWATEVALPCWSCLLCDAKRSKAGPAYDSPLPTSELDDLHQAFRGGADEHCLLTVLARRRGAGPCYCSQFTILGNVSESLSEKRQSRR